jgi:hypothetical protein
MKETFEDYLQRLKDRRTEDDYKYTDEDFELYKDYIENCYKADLSVYKCLEFMYFAKQDMDDQLFNREPKQETEVSDFINKLMYRIKVLRTGIENALVVNDINEVKKILSKSLEDVPTTSDGKWQKIKQEKKYTEEDLRKAIDFIPYHLAYGNMIARLSDKDIEEFIQQLSKK